MPIDVWIGGISGDCADLKLQLFNMSWHDIARMSLKSLRRNDMFNVTGSQSECEVT